MTPTCHINLPVLSCPRLPLSSRSLAPRLRPRRPAEVHEESFRCLGGTVPFVILGDLGEGVALLAHYRVVALPGRAGGPDRDTQTALNSGNGAASSRFRGGM